MDSDELNEADSGEENIRDDDSFIREMPVKRKRKLAEPDTTLLTRHFQITKEFPPLYTGGKFSLSKDNKTAFAINNGKVSIFDFKTG